MLFIILYEMTLYTHYISILKIINNNFAYKKERLKINTIDL